MADILPAIFFGHRNPMNKALSNAYTEGWRRIGEETCLFVHRLVGARQNSDPISFPVESVDGGSISMLTVRVGSRGRDAHASL